MLSVPRSPLAPRHSRRRRRCHRGGVRTKKKALVGGAVAVELTNNYYHLYIHLGFPASSV